MAYKKDVDDPRESPSFVLMEMLLARGAVVTYNDPHVPSLPKMRHHDVPDMDSSPLTPEYLAAQDCVLIATDHSAYDPNFIVQHAKMVLDTRNATKNVQSGREDSQSVSGSRSCEEGISQNAGLKNSPAIVQHGLPSQQGVTSGSHVVDAQDVRPLSGEGDADTERSGVAFLDFAAEHLF